jgi:hypothetical protein
MKMQKSGIVCGLCHRYVYLGGLLTKNCSKSRTLQLPRNCSLNVLEFSGMTANRSTFVMRTNTKQERTRR